MPKERYHFNLDSLSFTEVKHGLRYWSKLFLRYLLAGIALAVISYIIFSYVAYTPRERHIAEENEVLRQSLVEMKGRYEQLTAVLVDLEQRDNNIYRTIFESEPVRSDAQMAVQAMNALYEKVKAQGPEHVMTLTYSQLSHLNKRAAHESQLFNRVIDLAQSNGEIMSSIPAIQPVRNEGLMHIAAPFGVRIHPFYKVLKMHTGVDYSSPVGTPVYATANGVVRAIRQTRRGLGNNVELEHGHGYTTLYAHLDSIAVAASQAVSRGDVIGYVGNTGMSMAPHLHYEVRLGEKPVDPLNYFFLELGPVQLASLAKQATQTGQTMD